jgi:hypothetical protein
VIFTNVCLRLAEDLKTHEKVPQRVTVFISNAIIFHDFSLIRLQTSTLKLDMTTSNSLCRCFSLSVLLGFGIIHILKLAHKYKYSRHRFRCSDVSVKLRQTVS